MACAPACLPQPGCFDFFSLISQEEREVGTKSLDGSKIGQLARATHPTMLRPPTLSLRGQCHRDTVTPFWSIFDQMLGNAFCHETNTKVRRFFKMSTREC